MLFFLMPLVLKGTSIESTWTVLESQTLLSPRAYHSAAVLGDKWFIFGGENGTTYFNDSARIDITREY